MTPPELLRALRTALAADLAEQVQVLETGLLALERAAPGAARAELVGGLFRAAHGLKGSARAAGLPALEAACHALESILGEVRDAGRVLGPEDVAALLRAVDALADAQRRLAEAPDAALDEDGLERGRVEVERRGAAGVPSPRPSPRSRGERGEAPGAAPAPNSTATGDPGTEPSSPPAPTPAASPAPAVSPTSAASPATAPPPTAAPPAPPPRIRIAPERLEAVASATGRLLASAATAEQRALRAEELGRDVHKLRVRARAPGPEAAAEVEAGLRRLERALGALRARLALDAAALEQRARRLAADVRGLRLMPWTEATAGLPRLAHDLAVELGKEVELDTGGRGRELELDRAVIDALRDPLAQLVRNAVDHGIEPPDERRRAGKPPRGRIEVDARVEGERVLARVRDDGRGLDAAALAETARRRGISPPPGADGLLGLVFLPGFSTRGDVTAVSGRGVGLDVVASAVRARRGRVAVRSIPGRGATFELEVPTALYGLRAVIVRDAGQVYALPSLEVERVVRLDAARVRSSEGRPMLLEPAGPGRGGAPVPLAPLAHALGLEAGTWRPGGSDPRRLALVLGGSAGRAAIAVEEVLAERELSLEPLAGRLGGNPLATAVAALPGGELAVVLAAAELAVAVRDGPRALLSPPPAVEAAARRLLLADDAATTRALARSILEASGYEVVTAADGEQAWALLQQAGADLVVSDVEMPRLDGFQLTRAIRASPRFARLPVVLLTALESEADRRRGLEAGASAYLVKSGFDQRLLLETIAELLGEVP